MAFADLPLLAGSDGYVFVAFRKLQTTYEVLNVGGERREWRG